ncbi:MAG: hybrid sensor histidine kinase/response regulator [Microcoleaceae cyanobacterium MO_207.B10]|nr:hybrid sensor histidine kinase/response regulator [Microcoleaceae cyanobacterium MO_207.B10]
MKIVLNNSDNQNQKNSILIVDDNPINMKLAVSILEGHGYNILIATDGQTCLTQSKYHSPDIILMDVLMPGIDGFETCKFLKEDPETRDIPVIFMTALSNIEDKMTGFQVGGVDYVTKPIKIDEVLARVKVHIQLRNLTKRLRHKNVVLQEEINQRIAAETMLKQTLKQLQTTQKQMIAQEKLASLGALTSGIAHELCNPLNFVQNFALLSVDLIEELMEELEGKTNNIQPDTFDDIKEIISDIKHNANGIYQHSKRAERIIQNMVRHSKIDMSEFQPSNLNIILRESLDLVTANWKQKNFQITVNTNYEDSIHQIYLVYADITQALMNIFDNAYCALKVKLEQQELNNQDFTPTLSVKTRNLEEKVEICIYDNGTGIDPKIQDKIFDPFITTKPPGEGIGLGLSLAYDIIVRQHQGNITVNTKLENYTEFIIEIPLESDIIKSNLS